VPLAENASGCDDQRYGEDSSTTNTARWRTGFDPGRHRLVRDRNPGSGCFEPDRLTGSSSWHVYIEKMYYSSLGAGDGSNSTLNAVG
jgi:hypothetical protein